MTSLQGAACPARLSDGLAAFLLRLAAYFQGRLASLPRLESTSNEPLTVIDASLDNSSEPLIVVRMNRHLSRRLRRLTRRGRVQRSGEMRVATLDDKARCNLSPGQFMEYGIRVYRYSRPQTYGLGLGRRALRLDAIFCARLQGAVSSLRMTASCLAPLSPD